MSTLGLGLLSGTHQISLSVVDWLVIVIYFMAILGIGFYLKRHTKTGDDLPHN